MITFGQVSQFGALATYPEVRALQQFLAQQGKFAASVNAFQPSPSSGMSTPNVSQNSVNNEFGGRGKSVRMQMRWH